MSCWTAKDVLSGKAWADTKGYYSDISDNTRALLDHDSDFNKRALKEIEDMEKLVAEQKAKLEEMEALRIDAEKWRCRPEGEMVQAMVDKLGLKDEE